ncbi:hypothetical protein HETIRDRAFT_452079 [Heterobasidion irregulare TC 32-1]|uniref:Uncharacterized protein n=1 Tax=Heterobasidion irregulare (strain TC 32-1) TaxID=747525 RepID=W4K3T1_HETIT|nr:uncharacterized protein HETIRDRAFT_452079 [Heterobasidion irregulare TC 32-1]ETW80493.1 hypothetical protein HETIRDRAFT_452079 [Heterobasidion irregulare TC 32-1]
MAVDDRVGDFAGCWLLAAGCWLLAACRSRDLWRVVPLVESVLSRPELGLKKWLFTVAHSRFFCDTSRYVLIHPVGCSFTFLSDARLVPFTPIPSGSLPLVPLHSVRPGLVLTLKHHAFRARPSLSTSAHAGALRLVAIRRTHRAMRPRQAPIVGFVSGIAVSSRIPVPAHACARFIAWARALPSRASSARLRLWFLVTCNGPPGFWTARISPLPGPRQLLVTAHSHLILVRCGGSRRARSTPSHTFMATLVRITPLAHRRPRKCTPLASTRIRLAESRSALGQGSLFAAPSRQLAAAPVRASSVLGTVVLPPAERREATCSSAQVSEKKSSLGPYQPGRNALRPAPRPSSANPSFGTQVDGDGTSWPIDDGVDPSRLVSFYVTSRVVRMVRYDTTQYDTTQYNTARHESVTYLHHDARRLWRASSSHRGRPHTLAHPLHAT